MLAGFTGTYRIAADVPQADVDERLAGADIGEPVTPRFLLWLGERTGSVPDLLDAVLVAVPGTVPVGTAVPEAPGTPAAPPEAPTARAAQGPAPGPPTTRVAGAAEGSPPLALVPRDDLGGHARVARALGQRRDVRVFADPGGTGLVTLGRGLAGRLEVSVEVDRAARSGGLARRLLIAARALAPHGEPLFAQVAPGNAASLRAFLAAGFRPIGSEVRFVSFDRHVR